MTPIPSGQFSSPPILDFDPEPDSNPLLENETVTPLLPDPPVPADSDQLSAPGPSKRRKTTRGSKTKAGVRGGRSGGRQRAKATAAELE